MGRIRTVKPEFFRHELLQDLQAAHPNLMPMLVFAGLWTLCDKSGRFEWKPRQIKLDVLPFLDFDMAATLDLLESSGLVLAYEVDGRAYGLIPTFRDHQRITGKEGLCPERFPGPEQGTIRDTSETHPRRAGDDPGAQEREEERERERERKEKKPSLRSGAPKKAQNPKPLKTNQESTLEEVLREMSVVLPEDHSPWDHERATKAFWAIVNNWDRDKFPAPKKVAQALLEAVKKGHCIQTIYRGAIAYAATVEDKKFMTRPLEWIQNEGWTAFPEAS